MLLLLLPLLTIVHGLRGPPTSARPFYVIGHMANSFYDLRWFLERGVNAIETDVSFDSDGTPEFTYHGFPCDSWRFCFWKAPFPDYLDYVKAINAGAGGSSGQKPRLALLYLDLKVSSLSDDALVRAGQRLAQLVVMHLYDEEDERAFRQPWILLGVPDVDRVVLFQRFRETFVRLGFGHLLFRVGYDVYLSSDGPDVEMRALEEVGITSNIWLSSGATNWLTPDYERLANLVRWKDEGRRVDGVYHWTIDAKHYVRRSLNLGIDGIVTNSPSSVLKVLDEEEFSRRYRLATIDDWPWGRRN